MNRLTNSLNSGSPYLVPSSGRINNTPRLMHRSVFENLCGTDSSINLNLNKMGTKALPRLPISRWSGCRRTYQYVVARGHTLVSDLTFKFLGCFNDRKACHYGRSTSRFTYRIRTTIRIAPNNLYIGQRRS